MKATFRTTDDTLQVYAGRDLSSGIIARLPKSREIQLSAGEVFERREWMEATLSDGTVGYTLGPSARGHTTLGATPSASTHVAASGYSKGSNTLNETAETGGHERQHQHRAPPDILVRDRKAAYAGLLELFILRLRAGREAGRITAFLLRPSVQWMRSCPLRQMRGGPY